MSKEPESLRDANAGEAIAETPAQLATLARALIVRSKTNPRTHFDADYIKELAASIKEHGILQPILVRPLPGSRVQETFEDLAPGAPAPTHEIVCGECRWRACEIAGVEQLPVLVRHLSDLQVLQVQLVENLKRRDLHPLEEAEGFDRLMKDHGLTVEDIAARVDKSASQIYVTLKLLELTPECREELYAGKLTRSTALLVARAPAYLQTQIAKDIMTPDWQGETMSYRQAVKHIQQRYMLQLANADFDIKDASLVAKAGACGTCAKNTGANKDMFGDVAGGDTCTDPKCFDSKKLAHAMQLAQVAEAKGQKVIQGKEAKELIANEYSTPKGYELLDSSAYINGRSTTLRKVIGKDGPVPVLIVNPHTKKLQEALPTDVANKLIKQADRAAKAATKNKPTSKHDLETQFELARENKAVEAIYGAIMAGKTSGITVALARVLASHSLDNIYGTGFERATRLLAVPAAKVAPRHALETFLKKCPDAMVGPALLLLLIEDELENGDGLRTPMSTDNPVALIAEDAGVSLAEIDREVKAELREAVATKAPTADGEGKSKPTPAKKATKRTGDAAFMKPLTCSPALQAVVGIEPLPRTEIVSKLWAYIKKHKLQDAVNKRMVNADEKLRAVFGKDQVSMFEMAGLIGSQVGKGAAADTAIKAKKAGKTKKTSSAEAKAGISQALSTGPLKPQAAWPFPTAAQP